MANKKITEFDSLASPANNDALYIVQVSDSTDKKITAAQLAAYFGSATYTVETATDNKTITSTATNYLLVFTRQATGKTITLPDAGTTGRVIRINVAGSGAGNVSLANGDAATVGGFAVGDWEWYGNGGLTIVDDGSNWQVLESGIWDSYDVTYDSIDYPQDKYTNGRIVRRGHKHETNVSEASMWNEFSSILATTGDVAAFIGAVGASTVNNLSRIEKTDSTTITVYRLDASSAPATLTITSTASGTWTDTIDVSFLWETKNTVWTS